MNYLLHVCIMIEIYSMLALSLNLLLGFGGLMSLCHAAFYGIGAYTATLLMVNFGLPFIPALVFSVLITGSIALLLSFPALRFRGDTFVLVTLGFQVIIFSILYNWVSLTRGPYGIPGIPRPQIFGIYITDMKDYVILTSLCLVAVFLVLRPIYHSPFGLSLKSLREDEMAAESVGIPAFRLYSTSFCIAGALAAIPGALYATYVTYIDPTSFNLDESIFQLTILLVGGSGNIRGPIVGAVFMVVLPEILRFIGLPDSVAPNMRQIIYGLLLIVLMFFRPQGILGEYRVR